MPTCNGCGAEIEWVKLVSGKKMPVNPTMKKVMVPILGHKLSKFKDPETGKWSEWKKTPMYEAIAGRESHFATCPNRDHFRKPRGT